MRERRIYCFYIMASRSRTLYCGISGNLQLRVQQHRNHVFEGFTDKYKCERLVYFERFGDVVAGIARETQGKKWSRTKKLWLIERENPTWIDLAEGWGRPLDWVKLRPKE
jgi:putative endonuclease